jgi:peptide/nickel transport system substrate-binding protein
MYETLLTPNANYEPQPMLADAWEVSRDGLTYTFNLRKGVKFHTGQEMKADDVIASMRRWGSLSPYGGPVFQRLNSLEKRDDYTVELKLNRRYGSLLNVISNPGQPACVMPREIAEAAGKNRATEFIGTGPFKFAEWQPGVSIRLTRFDDYNPRSEPNNGLAGARIPYVKEVVFVAQPDTSARLSALLAGDIDFAMNLSADQFDLVKERSDITYQLVKPYYMPAIICNNKMPFTSDLNFRRAVAAGLDCNAIMDTLGPSDFWRTDGAWMPFGRYYSTAGTELFNQNNPDKARDLLKQAGYNGEELTYMSTRQYDFIDKPAQVATQQLRAAGFNINLEVIDWATLVQRRSQPTGWTFFTTGIGQPIDPTLHSFLACASNWPGFYCNPKTDELLDKFQDESSFEGQYKVWEQIQTQFWSDCSIVKFGDYYGLYAMRKNVEGWSGFMDFWAPNIRKT